MKRGFIGAGLILAIIIVIFVIAGYFAWTKYETLTCLSKMQTITDTDHGFQITIPSCWGKRTFPTYGQDDNKDRVVLGSNYQLASNQFVSIEFQKGTTSPQLLQTYLLDQKNRTVGISNYKATPLSIPGSEYSVLVTYDGVGHDDLGSHPHSSAGLYMVRNGSEVIAQASNTTGPDDTILNTLKSFVFTQK